MSGSTSCAFPELELDVWRPVSNAVLITDFSALKSGSFFLLIASAISLWTLVPKSHENNWLLLFLCFRLFVFLSVEGENRGAVGILAARQPREKREGGGVEGLYGGRAEPGSKIGAGADRGPDECQLPRRQRSRTVLRPFRGADQAAFAVEDPLHIAAVLECELAAVREHDGVALIPVLGAIGRLEFGDDPAAVAIEHALLGERAVAPVAVDVGAPR